MLLGLTLAAVAIVGAVSLYNAARESANRSQALTLLNQLRANVESVFAGAPSYGNSTDLIATVDRRGGIPDSARVVANNKVQIRHPFGGLVTIHRRARRGRQPVPYRLQDVDDEVCAALGRCLCRPQPRTRGDRLTHHQRHGSDLARDGGAGDRQLRRRRRRQR